MWCVTRQHQWPDGDFVVEISSGGIDYTNPGALCKKYSGEFEEFNNPQEAVEAGIRIAQQWKKDSPDKDILIGSGCTAGMTMPFDGLPLTIETYNLLRHNAKECYDELEKCDECGELLGKERYGMSDIGEYNCCSAYCAEKYWAPVVDEEELEEVEE